MEFKIKNVTPFEVEPRDFTIEWNKIESVYKGRLNACACGCSGQYLYTQHYANYRAESDGNMLLLDDVSEKRDHQISKILTDKFLNNNNISYQRSNGEFIFEVETDRYMETDENGWEEEIVKGFRIYQKFKPFKIK